MANNRPSPPPPFRRQSTSKPGRSSSHHRPSTSSNRISQSPPDTASAVDLTKVRAHAACKSCRTKKIKCLPNLNQASSIDGGASSTPGPCQQCLQTSTECVYPPTRDRAAYSRQYVANLENRVQQLELLQNRMLPLLEAYESGQSVPGPSRGRTTQRAVPTNGNQQSSNDYLGNDNTAHSVANMDSDAEPHFHGQGNPSSDDEDDDAGQMTQDERGNYRWIGSSNTLSILESFSHNNRSPHEPTPPINNTTDGNPYFGPVAGAGVVKALPEADEVVYPSAEEAADMIDAFFQEVHPILPVMEEKQFREAYKASMDRKAKGQPVSPGGFISVVFAIFALGERALVSNRAWQREKSKIREGQGQAADTETVLPGEAEAGVIWYERAQILHYTTLKDVTIHQVQCLTLLAAFQASVNAMPMSWMLAGQAIRVAQDLGLHRSTARYKLDFTTKQIRSRCWWAIYGLERLVSIGLGRPLGVEDLDIDVALPVAIGDKELADLPSDRYDAPDNFEEPPEGTMSGFIALTKLCKIAGRVAQVLYRPSNGRSVADASWAVSQQNTINKLDKTLKDWLVNEVPAKYKDPSSTARPIQLVSAVLSNAYFVVLLTLHRNFLPSNPDFPRPRPPSNSQSLSHLVEAARSVIHVAAQQRVLLPPSHHLSAACHNLWSSAIILLLCEVQAKDQVVIDAVGSSVESCRNSLQALEPAWPGSRKLKELLNNVEIRTKEVAVNGPPMTLKMRGKNKRKQSQDGLPSSKRIMSTNSMPPPASTVLPRQQQNSDPWQYAQFPSSSPVKSHSRVYELSDTRTIVHDEEPAVNVSNGNNPANAFHSQALAPDQIAPANAQTQQPFAFDTAQMFDIGGVTFDGLEMLQGFDFNAESTSFWNTFISPTAGGRYAPSGNTTPGSGGGGPSPSGWNNQPAQQMGSGSNSTEDVLRGLGGVAGGNNVGGFWDQVAPSGYDWGADPSVPFNIG